MIEHLRFETLASTQETAEKRIADRHSEAPLLVSALAQTHGRGSRGRDWISETGNMYASLALQMPPSVKTLQLAPYMAALGALDTLKPLIDGAHVSLKWPNDVLIDGAKAAGILITVHHKGPATWIIIGVGINLTHHPSGLLYPATNLRDHGSGPVEPHTLAYQLAEAILDRLTHWAQTGNDALISEYLRHADRLGQDITVKPRGTEDPRVGRFDTIDTDGALILVTPNGPEKIYTGDVFPDLRR